MLPSNLCNCFGNFPNLTSLGTECKDICLLHIIHLPWCTVASELAIDSTRLGSSKLSNAFIRSFEEGLVK